MQLAPPLLCCLFYIQNQSALDKMIECGQVFAYVLDVSEIEDILPQCFHQLQYWKLSIFNSWKEEPGFVSYNQTVRR